MSTRIPVACYGCGRPINDPTMIIWNGRHYHTDHVPRQEPAPVFEVAQVQPDSNCPGLWIGFKSYADRDVAMKWFKSDDR